MTLISLCLHFRPRPLPRGIRSASATVTSISLKKPGSLLRGTYILVVRMPKALVSLLCFRAATAAFAEDGRLDGADGFDEVGGGDGLGSVFLDKGIGELSMIIDTLVS